jgi:hypothetical protein
MEYPVKIEGFEGHRLAVTSDEFISNSKLLMDGQPAPSGEKRGEFILHRKSGSKVIAQLTSSYLGFDPVPRLTIDGKVIQVMPPLDRFEWVWSAIPLILFFTGGLLGTLFGILGFAFNVRVFRTQRSNLQKFLLTAMITLLSAGLTYGLPVTWTFLMKLVLHRS